MIGWWLLGELIQRRSPWIIPNLLATTFYGERAYRAGFIVPTWSGLAGTFAVYSAAGVLFAIAGRERKGGWMLVAVGITTGLALNWFCFGIVLHRINPLVQIYLPDRLITVSHILYGAALASYPSFVRQLQWVAGSTPPPFPPPIPHVPPAQPEPDHHPSDEEVSRGVAQRTEDTGSGHFLS